MDWFGQKKKISEQKNAGVENEKKHAEFLANVESRLNQLIQQHVKTLAVKESQTVTKDDYGNINVDRWVQEIAYFIKNVLLKDELISRYLHVNIIRTIQATGSSAQHLVEEANDRFLEIGNKVMGAVAEYQASDDQAIIDIDSLDPIAFEHHCAELLRNDGWNARVTQASGDQGIDVIATRGNVKAVFQCKKYAQPVGNGAVQEIVAGKQFEQADIAAVVSNATFTPSAKQLADTTGVHLLHYSDLDGFAEKLGMA